MRKNEFYRNIHNKYKMSQMSQMSQSGVGNTKPLRSRGRRFVFTLNNYTEEEVQGLENVFVSMSQYFVMGREEGEQGTPHIQGYVEFKNQVDFTRLKSINNRVHWEKAKGTRRHNEVYCTKEKKFIIHKEKTLAEEIREEVLSEYDNVVWYDWQQEILDMVSEPCQERRKIHWYWEEVGNRGKSFLATYLSLRFNTIVCDGTKADIFNQVRVMIHDEKEKPEIVIVDLPREGYINMKVLEQLKNGIIYSGKYEGGKCALPKLHVLVFSNREPEYEELSEDRWSVHRI